jgi:tRNA dimethylallyltransferase
LKKFLVVIAGPTASGKTALAVELALLLKTEIVSADSRQFYKEMNIGTAKPTAEQLKRIKHHFVNSLSVKDDYNAGAFETDALKKLNEIFSESDTVILAGGSGLYIDAICNGFDRLPEHDENIRSELSELFKAKGIGALQEKLKNLDPEYYNTAELSNTHRVMRAIEVCLLTGKKFSQLRSHKKANRNFSVLKIGLSVERKILYERINERVDQMMQGGLLEEAKQLFDFRHYNSLQTVGYKELFTHLEEKISLDEAIELIKRNSRRYAKRQLTWFNKDKEIYWFSPEDQEIVEFIKKKLAE